MKGPEAPPERVAGGPPGADYGTWGPDTALFAFVAPGHQGFEVWAAREPRTPATRIVPTRLINGPFRYTAVVPAVDGRKILAIGSENTSKLVRYDVTKKRFLPYLGGIAACELDFSRDGHWLTYVQYPDRSLWKARSDGTSALRLTVPPMQAIEPRWSPDGAQIAFEGQFDGGPRRLFLIPATGGPPKEALPGGSPQGVPSWSPDGASIVFGDIPRDPAEPLSMSIHILNLNDRSSVTLPNSNGLWSPRWSPDGRFIAALTADYKELRLYDLGRRRWRTISAFTNIDHAHWSSDSAAVYFRGVRDRLNVGQGFEHALYRVRVASGAVKKIADLDHFPSTDFEWFGITPDGTPLGLAGFLLENIYAIPVP
jgi:dipeptidyl aminopeptidase/acylaminoacyl peptidase